ncbi:MAG: hypothetical protein QNJ63_08535 [Calothrix sp. MO_192.B10]|nr:hypothetical protein [Calothrix sp. MO_192.B10]
MNKFQAAFEILYFLSCVDGDVDQTELAIVQDFLTSNYGNINFNPRQIINSLALTNGQGMYDEFKLAANIFKDLSGVQDKLTLLDFAYSLIAADGYVTDEEGQMFYLLGNLWNIDIDRYLRTKFLPGAL